MSVWNPENVNDVAESIGIAALHRDVVDHLARDVEFRISQVLEEALKFMRHGKRTTLTTQDLSQALRLLDVEPLYGYESTRSLRFGEASIGPGQSLFYVEDDEVDFEKLINAPLPKVPREMSFTAHWLAVEGVQPSIPQNPTQADQRNQDLSAKGPAANQTLSAMAGNDNVAVKPLVKHVLSQELQQYFNKICEAIMDDSNDEFRSAAFASLKTDPGLHQLVPYFVQFVADKVTHSLKSIFVLTQAMQLTAAILENPSLYIAPYVSSLVPSVLTCLLGKQLGSPARDGGATVHFALRDYAASLLATIARLHGLSSRTLKPRIARSCMKHFLDSHRPFGSHYGALLGLTALSGAAGVRSLILPNLKVYDAHLQEGIRDDTKREQAEFVVSAIIKALELLEDDSVGTGRSNANGHTDENALRERLVDMLGEVVGQRVYETGRKSFMEAVLENDLLV